MEKNCPDCLNWSSEVCIGCVDNNLFERPLVPHNDLLVAGYLVEWGRASMYKATKEEADFLANFVNSDNSSFVAVVIPLFKKSN